MNPATHGTPGPLVTLPALSKNVSYKADEDFATIGHIVTVPNIMVVSQKSDITSLNGLIEHAKDNPGRVRFGSPGSDLQGMWQASCSTRSRPSTCSIFPTREAGRLWSIWLAATST